jgi:phenylpropionate dioxygenase-like ring-hydroxylating dioxygenase large terminal subunit
VERTGIRGADARAAARVGRTDLHALLQSANPFRDRWYAVAPVADLPTDRPYGIELFNTPLVVFHDKISGRWHCLLDRCRHRGAALSCGTATGDGTITCLYHGWRYDPGGLCIDVPSVPGFRPSQRLRVERFATEVRGRILWVFAGDPEAADPATIPPLPWGEGGYQAVLFVRDTAFDWLIYNEHNADRHHLRFAHARTLGPAPDPDGPPCRLPGPAEAGLHYRQRLVSASGRSYESTSSFFFPATVVASMKKSGREQGISFTVTPLAHGRCRVIFLYFRAQPLPIPAFLFHIVFARVTEEDALLVRSQMKRLADEQQSAEEAFTVVPADAMARDYRAWLRESGGLFWQHEVNAQMQAVPCRQPRSLAPASASPYRRWESCLDLVDRRTQHFQLCHTCLRAHRRLGWFRATAAALALAVGLASAWPGGARPGLLLAVGLALTAWLADHLRRLLDGRRF